MRALLTSFLDSDYAASKAFYENILGLAIQREYDGEPYCFTNYDLGGMALKVYEWTAPYYGKGHSGLFIETDELDDIVNRLTPLGATINGIVVHEWGGRCCSMRDPFGNIFDLIDAQQKDNV
tara:strand:- start:216 stop:581 length:366 start_codon:yes stop_codon:yes gene_type:complete